MKLNIKNWVSIGVIVYLFLFGIAICFLYFPLFLFLGMIPPVVVVWLLVRKTPEWVRRVIVGLLIITAIFVLFFNDIIGPMTFAVTEVPFLIDISAQFFESWRFYWVMQYLLRLSWAWGFTSTLFLIGYKVYTSTVH